MARSSEAAWVAAKLNQTLRRSPLNSIGATNKGRILQGALTEVSSVPGADGGTDLASTPSGSFLYAIDQPAVGIDALSVSKTGSLSAIAGSPFAFPEVNPFLLSGIAIDSTGKFLYSADAGTNSVAGFTIDGTTGALAPIPGGVSPTDAEPRVMALT